MTRHTGEQKRKLQARNNDMTRNKRAHTHTQIRLGEPQNQTEICWQRQKPWRIQVQQTTLAHCHANSEPAEDFRPSAFH